MRTLLPLLIASALTLFHAHADTGRWERLSGIGDEIELLEGQTALIVSVSKPLYLSVKRPDHSGLGVRLKQPDRGHYSYRYDSSNRLSRYAEVDWRNPFPISGPCTIRLGTSAIASMKIVGPASHDIGPG